MSEGKTAHTPLETDLLEALREIEDVLANMGRDADHDGLAEMARKAIAKATGQ